MPREQYKGFVEDDDFILDESIIGAIDLLQDSNRHLFITGKAGTGKSTLLRHFIEANKDSQMAVVAPTGVAAVNIGGETIHRFLRIDAFADGEDVLRRAKQVKSDRKKLFKALQTIVIDELSMVRADLFDHLDIYLQTVRSDKKPFGGVRIIGFGDLFQLPPVVGKQDKETFQANYSTPYFFGADVYQRMLRQGLERRLDIVQLGVIYRQSDPRLIDFLNKLRTKEAGPDDLDFINGQVLDEDTDIDALMEKAIYLTVTNAKSDRLNELKLEELPGREYCFYAYQSEGFDNIYIPAALELRLKVGARVMTLLNKDGYQNGSIGTVMDIDQARELVEVLLDDGRTVAVTRSKWIITEQYYDEAAREVSRREKGYFEQLPLKLAWSVTIHKSQGQTFENLIIDFERTAFAEGQAYVALSRGVSLEGIHLVRPMRPSDIRIDRSIQRFLNDFEVSENKVDSADVVLSTLMNAIEGQQAVKMLYVKSNTDKAYRTVLPLSVEDQVFSGKTYLGLRAYCYDRRAERNFNVERILQIEIVDKPR